MCKNMTLEEKWLIFSYNIRNGSIGHTICSHKDIGYVSQEPAVGQRAREPLLRQLSDIRPQKQWMIIRDRVWETQSLGKQNSKNKKQKQRSIE